MINKFKNLRDDFEDLIDEDFSIELYPKFLTESVFDSGVLLLRHRKIQTAQYSSSVINSLKEEFTLMEQQKGV